MERNKKKLIQVKPFCTHAQEIAGQEKMLQIATMPMAHQNSASTRVSNRVMSAVLESAQGTRIPITFIALLFRKVSYINLEHFS